MARPMASFNFTIPKRYTYPKLRSPGLVRFKCSSASFCAPSLGVYLMPDMAVTPSSLDHCSPSSAASLHDEPRQPLLGDFLRAGPVHRLGSRLGVHAIGGCHKLLLQEKEVADLDNRLIAMHEPQSASTPPHPSIFS
ncbi:hypothetical protein HYQ46_004431 [Verticillium longisporum]|nr:hypothetical protein HYQ44_000666 [Verticillium longisporum]KAG7128554.1 hypothetical protein HYQ44_014871 [Verticillium longisporum]KAG7146762.1 hypothetical protein HYQ46_004431 [Verticillium longisporum]